MKAIRAVIPRVQNAVKRHRPSWSCHRALTTLAVHARERRPVVSLQDVLIGGRIKCSKSRDATSCSEWTTLAFQQQRAGSTAVFAFALAVVFVFLVLAAQ
jgi:hypothetical protein